MATFSTIALPTSLRAAPRIRNSMYSLDRCKSNSLGFMKSQNYKIGHMTGGGRDLSAKGVAGEIFQIALIMNGLTLVGVAVGFVLLRIETIVEEGE